MRTITRSLVAAATSLPLLLAGAGAASAAQDTFSANTAHPATVNSGYDHDDKGHGHNDKGHNDKGHGHDEDDDNGFLEDLLDELFGDDYGDGDGDDNSGYSNNSDDELLGGLLG
jgi:hypothetical protein